MHGSLISKPAWKCRKLSMPEQANEGDIMNFRNIVFTARAQGCHGKTGFCRTLRCMLVLSLLFCLPPTQAQPNSHELTGVLGKARSSGKIMLGYREFSIPFSYLSPRDEPVGYSIDLCRAIVAAIGEETGREIGIEWRQVTSATRMDMLTTGQIDLECGSTTNNAERSRHAAFSPIIFIAGTKLMVKRNSPVKSFHELKNSVIAVTAGTTNEKALQDLQRKFGLNYGVAACNDHEASLELLLHGKASALAADDVLLAGMIARRKLQKEYKIVGDFLSYDPYGIMYRKNDPELSRVVTTTLHALGKEGELERIYKQWFTKRLPSGEYLDLPISPHLETVFSTFGEKPE